ncbi:MAG: T9SS type A sorting domain-containing protein [Flavobacteriaceae bacterium]|nr:T9SS type A sorting domain-containing protein [Flavobacteriaceae bacterium]
MKITTLLALLCLYINTLNSQERVSVMFYNLLNYPTINEAARTDDLSLILNNYRPDVFAVCELNNASGAANILSILQTYDATFQMAIFVTNSSDDLNGNSNSLQQLVFYNHKVILETQHTPLATSLRDINHYTFLLNSDDQITSPERFDLYVTHLKASQGASNEAIRADMVNVFTSDLNNLPTTRPVIFAGDFNFYDSSEPGNVELLDNTNNIVLFDPANRQGSWHNNPSFIDMFSQATATGNLNGGSGGGIDDRFDFIYLSDHFLTNPDLLYSSGSYRTIGNNNNSNCWNRDITSNDCGGATYPFAIREALYNFSDHLPIFLEIETDKTLSTPNFETSEDLLTLVSGNYVSDQLLIQLKETNLQKPKLLFFNTLGQTVKRKNITNNSLISVNVSDFSSGMYYIKLENSNIDALKFIKR